jgi:hypothetical protein
MSGMDDGESLQTLREIAASEANLPPALAGRVAGTTISEMRRDAQALAQDLGYAEAPEPPAPPARTPDGRFASGQRGHEDFNRMVRQAAGYVTADEPQQRPAGDVGIGRGGAATSRQRQSKTSMNDLIRGAAGARSVVAGDIAEQLAFERARDA